MAISHVDEFVKHLSDKHEADLRFDARRGNRHHDKAIAAFRRLYVEDSAWLEQLKPLLEHPNDTVRIWVSTILLCEGYEPARRVLEADTNIPGLLGGIAEWTLKVWEMDELKPYWKNISPKQARRKQELEANR